MAKNFKIPKELVDQMAVIAQRSADTAPSDPAMSIPASQVTPVDQLTEPASEDPMAPHDAEPASTPPAQTVESGAGVSVDVVEVAQPRSPEHKPRKPRNAFSEADLEDWTARVAAMQQERDQAQRATAERQAKKKEQAAAWRTLRRLVEEAARAQDAEVDPVAADDLVQRVHRAPASLRAVIAAVLTAHGR